MSKLRFGILVMWGCSLSLPVLGIEPDRQQQFFSQIQTEHILKDIQTLSDPAFQGRQAGTVGGLEAGYYLQKRFKALGLIPPRPDSQKEDSASWNQKTPLPTRHLQGPVTLELGFIEPISSSPGKNLQIGEEILPVLDSPASHITAPVIFVGYGIVDPARGLDNYQGIDVHNRIVLFLRGKPPTYSQWVNHEEKTLIAKEQGAAGYITVTGPLLDPYEVRKGLGQSPLALYAGSPDDYPIPGAWISGNAMDQILQSFNESLASLQRAANQISTFESRPLPILAKLHWESHSTSGTLTNVVGMLPGLDPQLRDEIILIGAHRDHFGIQAGLLFPGADDNASGTAVMLEIARLFSQNQFRPRRSLLFASFDGEERGMLGSMIYVENPVLPLEKTLNMINLDHVGAGNGKLTVGVTRQDKTPIQQAAEQAGLTDHVQIYGYFPGGDHVPFYEAGVPTITVVSSGTHPHFHQPSDTVESLQPEILTTSTKFLLTLITRLADQPP